MPRPVNVAIFYYSSTGTVHSLAQTALDEASSMDGAEVRLRKAHELAPPEAIAKNEAWQAHSEVTKDIVEATPADAEWADVMLFGSPTRFGLPTSQLKQFIDMLGPLWEAGKLLDKVVSSFTASATPHGGQETTIVAMSHMFFHWGCIIVPPGYGDKVQFEAGNPYGTSHSQDTQPLPGDPQKRAMRYQTRRTIRVAQALLRGGLGEDG